MANNHTNADKDSFFKYIFYRQALLPSLLSEKGKDVFQPFIMCLC